MRNFACCCFNQRRKWEGKEEKSKKLASKNASVCVWLFNWRIDNVNEDDDDDDEKMIKKKEAST